MQHETGDAAGEVEGEVEGGREEEEDIVLQEYHSEDEIKQEPE